LREKHAASGHHSHDIHELATGHKHTSAQTHVER
jgi:hypothetical protein